MDADLPASPPQKRTVLVADDDVIFRTVAGGLLQSWGYTCIQATDGATALQILEQPRPPTIVLLDWLMPVFTGPEICQRVRARNLPQYIYFILVSARDGRRDSIEGLRSGADTYITKPLDADELRAKLETANRILYMEESLRDLHAETELFINSVPSILIGTDTSGRVTRWNRAAEEVFGLAETAVAGKPLAQCGVGWGLTNIQSVLDKVLGSGVSTRLDNLVFKTKSTQRLVGLDTHPLRSHLGTITGLVITGADVTQKQLLEDQLHQAQKLEAIGQLAAGIAHEINTPIQFVNDNVQFFKDSWTGLAELVHAACALRAAIADGRQAECSASFDQAVAKVDLAYVEQEIPQAIEQAADGLRRVSKIVRAMKEFSHRGSEEKQLSDINRAIETTVTVARNEWKYVADLDTDLDPNLPMVPCVVSQLNQVFLNIITNAAHAIGDVVGDGAQGKGRIHIRTRQVENWLEISISDTGKGIPEEIQKRVFEPFFTTKEVGKGTGQGLTLAHSIVTKEHHGRIWFESKVGHGTVFFIRLPLDPFAVAKSNADPPLILGVPADHGRSDQTPPGS